jgi:hypothetical protein
MPLTKPISDARTVGADTPPGRDRAVDVDQRLLQAPTFVSHTTDSFGTFGGVGVGVSV